MSEPTKAQLEVLRKMRDDKPMLYSDADVLLFEGWVRRTPGCVNHHACTPSGLAALEAAEAGHV